MMEDASAIVVDVDAEDAALQRVLEESLLMEEERKIKQGSSGQEEHALSLMTSPGSKEMEAALLLSKKTHKEELCQEVVTGPQWRVVLTMTDDHFLEQMRARGVTVEFPVLTDDAILGGEDSSEEHQLFAVVSGSRHVVEDAVEQLKQRFGTAGLTSHAHAGKMLKFGERKHVDPVHVPQRAKRSREAETILTVFVDSSNILIGARAVVSIPVMSLLWEKDRKVEAKYAYGSPVRGYRDVEQEWRKAGYTTRFQERGREAFVDDAIQNALSRLILTSMQKRMREQQESQVKRTVVLCTGDGNSEGSENGGQDFPSLMEALMEHGFDVEVWSWKASCSGRIKDLQRRFQSFQLNYLDDFRELIVMSES